MSERLTLHLAIRGRVQGVGFRYAMLREAEALGVAGWVRNRSDGSVEAVVHGPREAVERLLRWAERGPKGSAVSGVAASPAEGSFERFELRPTA
jgi:acylphosphatase